MGTKNIAPISKSTDKIAKKKVCCGKTVYIYDFRVCHKSEYWHILTDVDLDLLYKRVVDECDKKYGKYNPVPRPYRNK